MQDGRRALAVHGPVWSTRAVLRALRALRALGAITITGVAGCVLFLDATPSPGERCRFDGDDTVCGLCLVRSCPSAIDRCCGDPSCQYTLTRLEDCAGGDAEACRRLPPGPDSVGDCATSACDMVCLLGGATSTVRCEASATTCSCEAGNLEPTDEPCNVLVDDGAVCCADLGYPSSQGTTCDCGRFACKNTGNGCECELGGTGSESSCTGNHCCRRSGSHCACGDLPCAGYEEEVEACDDSGLSGFCGSDRNWVSSCTAGQ